MRQPSIWMFWMSLYFAKMLCARRQPELATDPTRRQPRIPPCIMLAVSLLADALMSFPFLLFAVPVLGTILTFAIPTGYDKSGILCPKLTVSQVADKLRLERQLKYRKMALEHRSGLSKMVSRASSRVLW